MRRTLTDLSAIWMVFAGISTFVPVSTWAAPAEVAPQAVVKPAVELTHPMMVEPQNFFTGEDKTVTVTVGLKLPPDQKPMLVEIDENGKRLQAFLPLLDTGILGDRKPADGFFSRRIRFYEQKARSIRLAVALDETDHAPLVSLAILDVQARPSFVEMVQSAFGRLFKKD